jgi:hypothetical protein
LKKVFNDVEATVKRATDDMVAAKKVADDMVVAERAAADKMAIDVDAGEKAVSNMDVMEGTTAEVASQDVAESSPTPVVGVKRATILGGSTPPAKCQFRGSWKPRYAIGPAFVLLFFYAYFVLPEFSIVQHVSPAGHLPQGLIKLMVVPPGTAHICRRLAGL